MDNYPIKQKFSQNTKKVKNKGKNIFIATNFLESMVNHPYPTRGEANDIYICLEMGANGLVLAGETAIGNYPAECILFIKKLIKSFPNKYEIKQYKFRSNKKFFSVHLYKEDNESVGSSGNINSI